MFSGKLVSGHIMDLVGAGVERIFYPMVFYEPREFIDDANSYNCPIVSGYPDVVRSAVDPERRSAIPLDTPIVTFRDTDLLEKACRQYLSGLGIASATIEGAIQKAQAAQAEYKQQVVAMGAELIAKDRHGDCPLIMLVGRPYHIDPLINHGISELLTDFGVDVLTEDCIPTQGAALENRAYRAAVGISQPLLPCCALGGAPGKCGAGAAELVWLRAGRLHPGGDAFDPGGIRQMPHGHPGGRN